MPPGMLEKVAVKLAADLSAEAEAKRKEHMMVLETADQEGHNEIKCPCGLRESMEEKDCQKTNCELCCPLASTKTRADRIRAMSDEDLMQYLYALANKDFELTFCQNKPECLALVDTDEGVPEEHCRACLLEYLQRPKEDA